MSKHKIFASSLAIGAIGEAVLSDLFGVWLGTFLAVLLAFLIITFLHVVVGERRMRRELLRREDQGRLHARRRCFAASARHPREQ